MFGFRSKFQHLFGEALKKEAQYDNVLVIDSASDGNFIAANERYFGVCWQVGGGGAFAVIPHADTGRRTGALPLYTSHTRPVIDLAFHPFSESIVASASEDATLKLWSIPSESAPVTEAVSTLSGHGKKAVFVTFHPSADNIMLSASADPSIKIWDAEAGQCISTLDSFTDLIHSVEWHVGGSQIGVASRDKKLRVFDARTGAVAQEADGHAGSKASRFVFCGERDRYVSVGFDKTASRQLCLYDARNFGTPLSTTLIDQGNAVMLPFYDADLNVLYIGGKGDASIRYYDLAIDTPYLINTFRGDSVQARGLCMVPKRGLDVEHNEVARMLKVTNNKSVVPIRFEVPRKAAEFQADLFPDAFSNEPALSASEWVGGANALPKRSSLDPAQRKDAPAYVPKSLKSAVASTSSAPNSASKSKPVSAVSDVPADSSSSANEVATLTERVSLLESEVASWKSTAEALQARVADLEAENAALKEAAASGSAAAAATAGDEPAAE